MIKKWVKVVFDVQGIHSYPNAPEEVSFLRHPHRHVFGFSVYVEVFHNERDIEFIMLKNELRSLWSQEIQNWEGHSCETLATDVVEYIKHNYPGRDVTVEVSEDGENSAIVEYTK